MNEKIKHVRRTWFAGLIGLAAVFCADSAFGEGGPWNPKAGEAYQEAFGIDPKAPAPTAFSVGYMGCSVPANVLWTGDKPTFKFQVVNLKADQPLSSEAKVCLIQYAMQGIPNDIWVPHYVKLADLSSTPLKIDIAAGGFANFSVTPDVPERFGGYALILDMGALGRVPITFFARTFKTDRTKPDRFPQLCLDNRDPDLLVRLNASPNRMGFGYRPTTNADYEKWYGDLRKDFEKLQAAGLTITVEIGGGGPQPMPKAGEFRPHLTDDGTWVSEGYPGDAAWLPEYDEDFKKLCKRLLVDFGYPKGPMIALKLWNEPWNGLSIAGWGADDLRYREMYTKMGEAIDEARAEAGVQVLLGGCDSSSNTYDKLFADGKDTFMKWLDFLSIHYQGMNPNSTVKMWVDRKNPNGRVLIWDTESWVANTDDRVSAVVATNLSTGHDRALGISHAMVATDNHNPGTNVRTADGKVENIKSIHASSVGAAIGAVNHFIGLRKFQEMLFKNGLPWVSVFAGRIDDAGKPDPEDGTVVVVGDIGDVFGPDVLLFRSARGFAEVNTKKTLNAQLAALPKDAPPGARAKILEGKVPRIPQDTPENEREARLLAQLDKPWTLQGARMLVEDPNHRFLLYDPYGNEIAMAGTAHEIPLDQRGFYLRGNGKPGSFQELLSAVRSSRIEGIEPLHKECLDFTRRIEEKPPLCLRLTNVLNRPIQGSLKLSVEGLKLEKPEQIVSFGANETKLITCNVVDGKPLDSNLYPLKMMFDAGKDGISEHAENLRVNLIARKTPAIDGKLDDWTDIPAQTVVSPVSGGPTLTEAAWWPFQKADRKVAKGAATAWLAYDDNFFYFAARVTDTTPDEGMVRYETRDDDADFYPAVCYRRKPFAVNFSARWKGQITVPKSGEWTFTVAADDAARLTIDGKALTDGKPRSDEWNSGTAISSAKLNLEAGKRYDLQLDYFQKYAYGNLILSWQHESLEKPQVIPTEFLFPSADAKEAGGLSAEYFRGTEFKESCQKRVDAKIDFPELRGDPSKPNFPDIERLEFTWPEGVRRYTYRRWPELPGDSIHDNVQIAFNVLSPEDKWQYPFPTGTMPKYTGYVDTDYEYALNPVAQKYGGGTEIWMLKRPGFPHKHFYPRSPKAPGEGPVKDGKLVIVRTEKERITECAIPWRELPDVKKALDEGRAVKFSFRVNDNASVGCMELARDRSTSKRNSNAFSVDWSEHWANELEFGWGK